MALNFYCPCCTTKRLTDARPGWGRWDRCPIRKVLAEKTNREPGEVTYFRHSWIDHTYRLRRFPDSMKSEYGDPWRYIAEPYTLSGSDFSDFAYLESHGFTVSVMPNRSKHYPNGGTLAVIVEQNPTSPVPWELRDEWWRSNYWVGYVSGSEYHPALNREEVSN